MTPRLGAPSSDPSGCCIEVTSKGVNKRVSVRAWHPLVSIPAQHFLLSELAHFIGAIVPPRKKAERRGPFPNGRAA